MKEAPPYLGLAGCQWFSKIVDEVCICIIYRWKGLLMDNTDLTFLFLLDVNIWSLYRIKTCLKSFFFSLINQGLKFWYRFVKKSIDFFSICCYSVITFVQIYKQLQVGIPIWSWTILEYSNTVQIPIWAGTAAKPTKKGPACLAFILRSPRGFPDLVNFCIDRIEMRQCLLKSEDWDLVKLV